MIFGDGWVTVSEAARLTNQTYWQVRKYIQKNKVPVERAGNSLLVRLSDVKRKDTGK
jgi:excisionase family DNA binding protein